MIPSGAHIAQLLLQSRPWVFFLSVLLFCAAALLALAGLAIMVQFSAEEDLAFFAMLVGVPLAPAVLLLRYGMRIGRLNRDASGRQLENVLKAHRAFWRFTGIALAIFLAVCAIIVSAALLVSQGLA